MSSIQAGITKSQDGGTPSGDRGTGKSRGTAEKIQPQSELKSHLEKTARFIKAFDILVRGFAWLSCILAAWLLSCLVDHWLLPLPSVLRWLVWAGLVAFTVWIAVWQITPLIIGRINPDYAAKRIERAEPRFKEGLIAWLQLSDMPDSGVPRGVMSALTYRAYRFIGGQDPSSTVDSSPLIRGLASFLILACIMALYSFISPKSSLATAERIAMPWRTVAAPTRVHLSEVDPGSTIVSAGKPLEVSVRAVGVRPDEPVYLMFSTRDGQIVSQAIALNEPDVGSIYTGVLTTTSSGVEHELEYWIEAGDAVTEKFDIELSPMPSVALERVELVYPAYTKLPKRISDGRDVEALEGTIATIVARSNQDLVRGQLEINPTQDPDGLLLTAEQIFPMDVRGRELKREWQPQLGEGQPSTLMRYSVRGYNQRSDSNLHPIEHTLTLVADVPPEIRLVGPKNRILRVRPTSKVQLEIRASDPDFGLNEVELSVHKAGAAVASRVILKGDGLKGKQVKRQPLDIGRLSMSPGDRLELHATARDNRHDPVSGKWSPNETHADPLIVEVVGPTQPSDVPSGNQTTQSDGHSSPEDPTTPGNENPRPSSGDSANGQSQPQDSSQTGSKNGPSDQNQTGTGQTQDDSGKQEGGEKGGEQSGVGGAGASSDDSGEAQSSSEQSGGGGSSSSPNDASQENGSGGSQGGNSQGNNRQSGSNKEQSQGGGAGSNSQDSASSDPRNSENSTGNNQSRNGNSGQRASQNDRGGSGGSPATDAEAMKQVEQFMREKGEAPSQSGEQNQENDGKGQQASASGAPQGSNKPNDAAEQSSNADSADPQGSKSDSSAKGDPSAESQSSTGSKQRTGENGSQNPSGQNSNGQNSNGQNSDGQNADGQNADGQNPRNQSGGNNQENSSSPQSSNDNSSNSNSGSDSESGKGSQSGTESGSGQSGSEQSGSQQSGNGSQDGQGGESSSGQSQDGASGKSEDGQSRQSGSSESSGQSGSPSSAGQETPSQKGAGQQGNEQQGKNEAAGNSEKGQSPSEKGSAKSHAAEQNASSGPQDAGQNSGKQPGEQNPKKSSAEQQQSGNESATKGQSDNQPSSSQESGSQSAGQQQSTQSPDGSQSTTGSGNSDSGNSANSSGRGSNRGSSNRAGGDVGETDAADKEAAAKAADMVLDYLERQRDQPDPELLREVDWDKNDLNRFVDRWKQARELASQGDDAARQDWEELLSSLNLNEKRSGSLGPMQRSDDFRKMSDSAVRIQPPKNLLKRWQAVQRALEKQ